MVGLLLYELKRKTKDILKLCVGIIIAFGAAFFIMKFIPQLIIVLVRTINVSAALRAFLGLDKAIEAVTYKQLAMAVLTFIWPILCYLWVSWSAHIFWNEEKYGTIHYFYSQPISRMTYWTEKMLVNFLTYAVCMILIYVLTVLLSLNGVPVKILREMTMEDVNDVMISVLVTGIMCVGVGTLLGSAVNGKRAIRWIHYCFGAMIAVCLLPGVFNILKTWMSSNKLSTEAISAIIGFLEKARLWVPLHWCIPWHRMGNALNVGQIGFIISLGIIAFAAAALIYSRRSLVRE